jgi:hypothetical protein
MAAGTLIPITAFVFKKNLAAYSSRKLKINRTSKTTGVLNNGKKVRQHKTGKTSIWVLV